MNELGFAERIVRERNQQSNYLLRWLGFSQPGLFNDTQTYLNFVSLFQQITLDTAFGLAHRRLSPVSLTLCSGDDRFLIPTVVKPKYYYMHVQLNHFICK